MPNARRNHGLKLKSRNVQHLVMGQHSRVLHDDMILKIIWPHIIKVVSWKDRFELLQNMRLCNIGWKILIDNSGEWLHNKICWFVSHFGQRNKRVKEVEIKDVGLKWKQNIHLEAITCSQLLNNITLMLALNEIHIVVAR